MAGRSVETSVLLYEAKHRHIPEEKVFLSARRENIKSPVHYRVHNSPPKSSQSRHAQFSSKRKDRPLRMSPMFFLTPVRQQSLPSRSTL